MDRDLDALAAVDPAAARRLSRRLRALEIFRHLGRLIVAAQEEQTLLEQVCRLLVDPGGYRLTWIGCGRDDALRCVEPLAFAGHEHGYLDAVEIRWSDTPLGRGPAGTAIRTGTTQVTRHIERDPFFAPWRDEALARGYHSMASIPIDFGTSVRGALNVYAAEPDAFDPPELALLEDLAVTLSHAITALRARQERARIDEEIRSQKALLDAIYAASPDMIFLHGPDLMIADVNERVREQVGCDAEAFRTHPPERFIGEPHTFEEAMARLHQALEEGAVDFEWIARRFDGSTYPAEVRLRRLEIDPETMPNAPRVVAVVRDLTEHKRAEQARLRLEKLRSIGVLAGGIAHDFNNLLTGIVGNVSLAAARLRKGRVQSIRPLLQEAEAACLRARELTRQLLTFARGGTPHTAPTDLAQLVRETARFCLRGSSVALLDRLPTDLPPVEIDAGQIAQVIQNLTINAVQALTEGGVITLEGAVVRNHLPPPLAEQTRPFVRLTIADNGPGIPPDHLNQIFDPYFTTRPDGTGLGLATVESIVRRHGGAIEVHSRVDEGTRFEIYLPVVEERVLDASNGSADASPQRPEQALRVLVLEDDPHVATVIQSMLEAEGHAITLTREGSETLTRFHEAMQRGERFDVALLDLTVPGGLGGREILPELRSMDPKVRAIATSGYSEQGTLAEYERHGFVAALPKPYRLEDLLSSLARAVQEPLPKNPSTVEEG